MKKSLLALAVTLAAASGANAAWQSGFDTTGNTSVGNGEMIVVLWDDVKKNSYAHDTGIRFDDLRAGTVNTSIALDSAALNTAFGGDFTNVRWFVGSASNHWTNAAGDAYETDHFGYVVSGSANSLPVVATDVDSMISFVASATQMYAPAPAIMGGAMQAGTYADNGFDLSLNNAPDYLAGYSNFVEPVISNLLNGMGVTGLVGATTNLWYWGFEDAEGALPVQGIRGSATLNLNGAGGSLVLAQSAPEVPVPAAVWLLGSALVGLGGVARKRKNA